MNQKESSLDLLHDRFPLSEIEHSISHRFEKIRTMFPDNIAVCTPDCRLTFLELDQLSNSYANTLLAKGVQPGDRVCFLAEHGHHQIVVIMAIIKARAIYVPLQAQSSRQHLISILEDADPVFLFCDSPNEALSQLLSQLWIQANFQIINISEITDSKFKNLLPLDGGPDDLAYIYYTSGSTGKPKGVVDNHRNVLHNIRRYSNSLEIESHDNLTLLQSCEFSGAVSNIFTALLNGATLLVIEPKTSGMQSLAHWLVAEKATIYHSVPSIFRELLKTGIRFPMLRIIRLEGDRANLKDVQNFQRHFHSNCRLLHGLGSTETGIVAQYTFLNETENNYTDLPLGFPTAEISIQITDLQSGLPIETGIGEITITSSFLAVGYWRQQELTEQRFKLSGNRRTYFTGDLGRFSTDGKLFFVGRKSDSDEKNRILRDVARIETETGALPGVELCVALSRKKDRTIDVYVQASGSARPNDLANLSGESLPGKLTSAYRLQFIIVDAIPFNAFGKIDLQVLQQTKWDSGRYEATPSNTEILVSNAFKQTLGLRYLGVNANFFEMGAHHYRQ